jgi:hypothetical protein
MGVSHPTRVHCWELACRDQKGIHSTIPLEFRQLKQRREMRRLKRRREMRRLKHRREMRRLKAEAREVVGVAAADLPDPLGSAGSSRAWAARSPQPPGATRHGRR